MKYVLKEGVIISGLQIEMRLVMKSAGRVWRSQGETVLRITSGLEGSHGCGSFHPFGYALDLGLPKDPKLATEELKEKLGDAYDVILERDHIHVEYDP